MLENGGRSNCLRLLLELENRKRKPHLAHETGAGAPCMNCKSTCPGLDLHFWRKICKNCKCGRDDHDVGNDEFPQFDLLFGPSTKFKMKPIFLQVTNKKQDNEMFEWVPPNISKDLAMDYMKALPPEKLPIKGSIGAALRRQLLQKQLPLHDVDYKVCDKLSNQEQKQFEKYLENIRKYAGQGKVMKILSAQPYDCFHKTLINATNKQSSNLQCKSLIPSSTSIHLRTPSNFVQNSCAKHLHESPNKQDSTELLIRCLNKMSTIEGCNYLLDNMSVNSNIARSQPIEGKFYENASQHIDNMTLPNERNVNSKIQDSLITSHLNEGEITPAQGTPAVESDAPLCEERILRKLEEHRQTLNNNTCLAQSELVGLDASSIAESMLANALLPPSAIHLDDIVASTLDEQELMLIKEKLTNKYSAMENSHAIPKSSRLSETGDVSHSARDSKFTNIENMGKQIAKNPERNLSSTEKTEDSGSQYAVKDSSIQAQLNSSVLQSTIVHSEQLQNQIFPHIIEDCNDVQNTQHEENLNNIEALKMNSTRAQKCEKCHQDICANDVAVTVEKANNIAWHPKCFACSVCNELLADLVYFYYKDKLYCGRDLATLLGIPRCFACDELIFVREYTVAEGHNYHVKHFCCWDCDVPLAGQQYITENDCPLCLSCYQTSYAKTCATCNVVIAANQQGVTIKNLNFHATETCFHCYSCKKNLLNSRMTIRENKLFCSKECIAKCLD